VEVSHGVVARDLRVAGGRADRGLFQRFPKQFDIRGPRWRVRDDRCDIGRRVRDDRQRWQWFLYFVEYIEWHG